MLQGGIRGINKILITGRVLLNAIPIGAPTNIVGVITRIFIISTIVVMVKVGIEASVVSVLPEPQSRRSVLPRPLSPRLVLPGLLNRRSVLPGPESRRFVLPEPLSQQFALPGPQSRRYVLLRLLNHRFAPPGLLNRRFAPLRAPVLAAVPLELPVRRFAFLGLPVRRRAPLQLLVLAPVNREKLLLLRKKRSGRPRGLILRKRDAGQGARKNWREPILLAELTAKGNENGIDCAHHYHYFARGGLSSLAA
jgi:hypothetical protein